MKRNIIHIDQDKCNGCGDCISACHEGAIRLVNGKAQLVGDSLCDGLGACLGECPQGAIRIEIREADTYNEIEALQNIMKEGPLAVQGHLKHLTDHGQTEYLRQAEEFLSIKKKDKPMACGCPGSMTQDFRRKTENVPLINELSGDVGSRISELQQWPVQLRLLNPQASFFQGAELVVAADCVPFTYADFHRKFLKGCILVVFCPKLDQDLEEYVQKMAEILRLNTIRSVTIVRMEVPCCGGTLKLVEEAVRISGKGIVLREVVVSRRGEIV